LISTSKRILVVGAGFAGAVAARMLAEAGYSVQVIDQRPHIAGNAHDEIDARGMRVHRYGPHLFHTSNREVVAWLSQFTAWDRYEHRVSAKLPDGTLAPLPINRRTLELAFREAVPDAAAAEALLVRLAAPIETPGNAEEYLLSRIGAELTELFFARYTEKMWAMKLSEMDASVVKRIPLRFDDEDRYFPGDTFQALPRGGYTQLFRRMLEHPRIKVSLGLRFEKRMLRDYGYAFLCCPIDEYFDFRLGELPYRSIRFHHAAVARSAVEARTGTVNYTDTGPFTRTTYWHLLPGHDGGGRTVTATTEEPCDYRDNALERYYPVKTADGRYQALYQRYAALAAREPGVQFLGRCGTYQYLDMHQVVNQTLAVMRRWLATQRGAAAKAA